MSPSKFHMVECKNITAQAILPIINKYVKRFTPIQWSLIVREAPDFATTMTLVDMSKELVHTIHALVLNVIKPTIRDSFSRKSSPESVRQFLETLHDAVGQSLSSGLAEAFNVSQEEHDVIEQLTAIIETEVTDKVSAMACAAIHSPDWSLEEVSESKSSSESPDRVVSHVTKCLKGSLTRLTPNYLVACWCEYRPLSSQPVGSMVEKFPSPQNVKSRISIPTAAETVADILVKWARPTPEQDGSDLLVEALDTASDIVEIILDDLHYAPECRENSSSQQHHFNVSMIVDILRTFFDSQIVNVEQRNRRSFKFAKKEFNRISPVVSTGEATNTRLSMADQTCETPAVSPPDATSSSEKSTHSEEVSGALTEIQDVIATMLTTPEGNDSMEPVWSGQTTSACASAPRGTATDDDINDLHFKDHLDSLLVIESQFAKGKYDDENDRASSNLLTFYSSKESPSLQEVKQPKESSRISSPLPEMTFSDLMTALLVRVVRKAQPQNGGSEEEGNIEDLITRLLQLSKDDKKDGKTEEIQKAILKDIQKMVSTPGELAEDAASSNEAFDDALLNALRSQLYNQRNNDEDNSISNGERTEKEPRVTRFCSTLRKALCRLFRCHLYDCSCIRCSWTRDIVCQTVEVVGLEE